MTNNTYTEDFNDIMSCSRERYEVQKLLSAWNHSGLPSDFYDYNVRFAFNKNSGCVFLVNDSCQVAMINDDASKLECFYTSPYDGHEGFLSDLLEEVDDSWHPDDIEWLNDIQASQ